MLERRAGPAAKAAGREGSWKSIIWSGQSYLAIFFTFAAIDGCGLVQLTITAPWPTSYKCPLALRSRHDLLLLSVPPPPSQRSRVELRISACRAKCSILFSSRGG